MKRPDSPFYRWWWRAWYGFIVLTLGWLGLCVWLSRPLAPWSQGWVGWWTGDANDVRPLWNLNLSARPGVEISPVDGNAAYRIMNGASIDLAYWAPQQDAWTWSGWVKVTSPGNVWPTNFLVVRCVSTPGFHLRAGFDAGHPRVSSDCQLHKWNPELPEKYEWTGTEQLTLGQWHHLVLSSDLQLQRLFIDGRVVLERGPNKHGLEDISQAKLLLSDVFNSNAESTSRSTSDVIAQDDIVLFDRVLLPEEVAALAARGRGAWAPEVQRADQARQVRKQGGAFALIALAALVAVQLLPRLRARAFHLARELIQPAYRAIRWVLAVGLSLTALLTALVVEHSRRADRERFGELLQNFQHGLESDWRNLLNLAERARDWVAAQTNLNQSNWEVWLHSNRFPYEHPGSLDMGYAEQVLPDQVEAHEYECSQRLGFSYRIHPPASTPRIPVVELASDPRLPIVLYSAPRMERSWWCNNLSVFGRDLLFQAPEDHRIWAEARRVEEVAGRNEVQTSSLEDIIPAGWFGKATRGLRLYVPWTLRTKGDSRMQVLNASDWRGVVFASVDLKQQLSERLGAIPSPIGFRLYTGGPGGDRYELVADSKELLPGTGERIRPYLRQTKEIRFFYRRLFLDAWPTETFEAQSMRRWAWWVGGVGASFTFLATALLFVQVRARESQGQVLEALRTANGELLRAQGERERLSRDLHDGSIQNLYGLGLHLQRVQALLPGAPRRAHDELNDSLAMLDQSIAELRQFILAADVDSLQQHTAISALEGLAERVRKTTQIDFRLHLDEQAARLNSTTAVQVLNIVREAVSNALRHANARSIEVRLEPTNGAVNAQVKTWRLSIIDDGCGFELMAGGSRGRGLKNLAARASELAGTSQISSAPGSGTRAVVEFPE